MGTRPNPLWLLLCLALGAGLAAWSLYVVGLIVLLMAALAFVKDDGPRRKRLASVLALLVGFELGIGTLMVWYHAGGDDPGITPYLVLLAAAGLLILATAWGVIRRGATESA